MTDSSYLQRQVLREREARKQAEIIAEKAIGELYDSNRELDRRVAERTAELNDALQRVGEADRLKAMFLKGLGAELLAPLREVRALVTDGSRSNGSAPDNMEAATALAEQALDRLDTALRTLVDFAAVMTGSVEVNPVPLRLGDVADSFNERWQRPSLLAGSLLVVEAHPGPDTQFPFDPERLQQIVDPLMDNALVHGGGLVQLTLELGSTLLITIRDEGSGLDELTASHAFDAFFREQGHGAGFGVGLTLARQVARAIDGDVWLEDSAAGATRFQARLPIS